MRLGFPLFLRSRKAAMTKTRRRASFRNAAALAAGALVLAWAAGAGAAALDLYYERAVMVAAHERCRLFTPPVASALAAAMAQARGAALRAGTDEARLIQVEDTARSRVQSTPCTSQDVRLAASRVRQAFEGYAQLISMDFPGEVAPWRGQRVRPTGGTAAWGLSQSTRFGFDSLIFGLARNARGATPLMAVATFADGAQPYGARLVLRDRNRTPQPYLDRRNADSRGLIPLASRLPPRFATLAFSAEARSYAGRDLRAPEARSGVAFRFPVAAADALGRLDPRDAVAIEFLFPGERGDIVRTAYVEVGDFAAGRAFLAAG